jgi:hypothetical protein
MWTGAVDVTHKMEKREKSLRSARLDRSEIVDSKEGIKCREGRSSQPSDYCRV